MPRATTNNRPREDVPSDTNSPNVEWKYIDNLYVPFPISLDAGDEEDREVFELNVGGTVVNSYLRVGQYSHNIDLEVTVDERRRLQTFVQTVPDFDKYAASFKWPWAGSSNVVRFTSKEDIGGDFKVIWDGRSITDIHDVESRLPIPHTRIRGGSRVFVEFTVIVWEFKATEADKSTNKNISAKYGCTFKLLSIGLLDDGLKGYNIESPKKRKRMAY
jgi:hypothetical protein